MTNKRILTLITLLLFLLLVVGCDVIKPNQPPEITSDPVETATVGVDYTYNVVAIDPNAGDVLTYSLTTEPEGMLIDEDSGVITWKADDITAAGIGDYDVVVVVSDDDGLSDSQEFTIEVSEFVVELVGIEVDPEAMTLVVGGIEDFKVTAEYNDDSTADVTSGCVYGIDNTSIVAVDKVNGVVNALEVGTATISISYTEEGITKGTTLPVIVEGTMTIRWLEAAVRYNAIGEIINSWANDPIPPDEFDPATLILTNGGYSFADINEFFNASGNIEDYAGTITIDGTGQLSGDATYTGSKDLPIKDYFEGDVEIIIYDVEDLIIHDGTMVGTYTQWGYAYFLGDEEDMPYDKAVLAPEQGPDWWFIGRTEYFAHGEEFLKQ